MKIILNVEQTAFWSLESTRGLAQLVL